MPLLPTATESTAIPAAGHEHAFWVIRAGKDYILCGRARQGCGAEGGRRRVISAVDVRPAEVGCMAGRTGADHSPRVMQLSPICRRCVGDGEWLGAGRRRWARLPPASGRLYLLVQSVRAAPPVSAGMIRLWWPEATPVWTVISP
jgi:hypothetical protein